MSHFEHPMDVSAIWKRFKKNKPALFGGLTVISVIIIGLSAPLISPHDPYSTEWEVLKAPNKTNLFGTDQIGRDVLSRCLWGTKHSLMIGLGTSVIATIIGVMIGAFAGYFKSVLDIIFMRIADFVLVLPGYFFYILIIATLRNRSTLLIIAMMASLSWPTIARIVRSEFLSLRELDYIKSAKSLGAGNMRIIFRHLLPNAMSSIIIVTTMNIAQAILLEAGLGFLGLTDPTIIGWGNMLSGGRGILASAWWVATFPGLLIFLTVLAFNLVGDGLRDALDPRLRGLRV